MAIFYHTIHSLWMVFCVSPLGAAERGPLLIK